MKVYETLGALQRRTQAPDKPTPSEIRTTPNFIDRIYVRICRLLSSLLRPRERTLNPLELKIERALQQSGLGVDVYEADAAYRLFLYGSVIVPSAIMAMLVVLSAVQRSFDVVLSGLPYVVMAFIVPFSLSAFSAFYPLHRAGEILEREEPSLWQGIVLGSIIGSLTGRVWDGLQAMVSSFGSQFWCRDLKEKVFSYVRGKATLPDSLLSFADTIDQRPLRNAFASFANGSFDTSMEHVTAYMRLRLTTYAGGAMVRTAMLRLIPSLNIVATVMIPVYALFVDTRIILLMLMIVPLILFLFVLLFRTPILTIHPKGVLPTKSALLIAAPLLSASFLAYWSPIRPIAYLLALSTAYAPSIYFLLKADEARVGELERCEDEMSECLASLSGNLKLLPLSVSLRNTSKQLKSRLREIMSEMASEVAGLGEPRSPVLEQSDLAKMLHSVVRASYFANIAVSRAVQALNRFVKELEEVKQFYRREMTDIRTDMRAMIPVTIAFTLFGAYMYGFIYSIIPKDTKLLGLLSLETDPNLVWLVLGLNSLLMVIGLSKAASTSYLEYRWMKRTLWYVLASFAAFVALFLVINYVL